MRETPVPARYDKPAPVSQSSFESRTRVCRGHGLGSLSHSGGGPQPAPQLIAMPPGSARVTVLAVASASGLPVPAPHHPFAQGQGGGTGGPPPYPVSVLTRCTPRHAPHVDPTRTCRVAVMNDGQLGSRAGVTARGCL